MSTAAQSLPSNTIESIEALQAHQARCRRELGYPDPTPDYPVLKLALEEAKKYENDARREGDFYRIGIFKYPAQLEPIRWQRTYNVIKRVNPGVDESPVYLAMLARQAATVELIITNFGLADKKLCDACDRILLGTTAEPSMNSECLPQFDSSWVILCNGLIDFVYQAAKAVVLSWRPKPPDPGATVSLGSTISDVESVLAEDERPLKLLLHNLHSFLFLGQPRPRKYNPPSPIYHPALSQLTNCNERFVIAHEYGHAVFQQLRAVGALDQYSENRSEELDADQFAFVATLNSSSQLDLIAPNCALQGGFFVVQCVEIIRQAVNLVRHCKTGEDKGDGVHPPNSVRKTFLEKLYNNQHLESEGRYNLDLEGALVPAQTLEYLWNRICDLFFHMGELGFELHPIWDNYPISNSGIHIPRSSSTTTSGSN